MIKAVIFDCFGVLTADKWREFVGTLPEIQKLPARDLNHAYDAGLMTERQFLDQVKELTGRDPGEVENLAVEEIGKNRQLLDYIGTLKTRYKIGLLSNIASNWVRSYFLTTEEQKLFDEMLFSYEAGTTKPDARIYRLILEKLKAEPSECVFIDDQPRYCEAAEQLGMKAVVYEDFEQMKDELEKMLAVTDN